MNGLLLLFAATLQTPGQEGFVVPGVETGGVVMSVHVWGEVQSPGTYLLPFDADVVAALSAAGGPSETANLGDVRIITPMGECDYDLDAFLRGEGGVSPALSPGATVYVSRSRSEWWIGALDVVYKVIVTVNLVWLMADR